MIDLNNLIDLFPSYFKENDSYKVDGKGLLQRFLDICGNYFQQYPLADLDSFLENLDVNKTNIIFIQNFWKFFGELPFAQGPIIDGKIFTDAFTGFNFDEALNQALRSQTPFTGGDANLNYRKLIQYSISLFKIRGTRQFFDIMFRLYGVTVFIGTPTNEDPFESDIITRFDLESTQYDRVTYDHYYRCKNCSEVTFTITPPDTLSSQTNVLSFANQMRAFIERFVPFYINPLFVIRGWNNLTKVKITVNVPSYKVGLGETVTFGVLVEPLITDNTFPSLEYQVAVVKTGETPTESDWSQPFTSPTYVAGTGNRDYYFRPVADTTQTKKVHLIEEYTNTQYMIWVDSPRNTEDRILSKDKPKVSLVVKAVQYLFTYRDGALYNTQSTKPSITWDTAPEGMSKLYPKGEAKVEVDYYGTQVFSITNFRTKRASVYIGVTEEYKEELDTVTLTLTPKFLLIKDNTYTPGGVNSDGTLQPGIYGSEDGENWSPSEYRTQFKVVNREGIEQPDAVITDITNSSVIYHSGDYFVPPTKSTSNYTFKAVLGDKTSETVNLSIRTSTTQILNPQFSSIEVSPSPLRFEYTSGELSATLSGILRVTNIPKASAPNYTPIIVVKNSLTGETMELNGIFEGYNAGTSSYTFQYTHTISSPTNHNLTFTPKGKTYPTTTVPVQIVQPTVNLYMRAYDLKDQWIVNNASASDEDKSKKRGTDLTFTAKAGKGNNIAKFTFDGSYSGYVTDNEGNSYDVDSEEPVSIEVKGDKTLTFTGGGITLTLRLVDFEGIVKISCSPTKATIDNNNPRAFTTVTGSTNKSEKFRFRIDGTEVIREIENNGAFTFETTTPGTHTFMAEDDNSKVAYFEVESLPTNIEVTSDEFEWDADDLSERSFEIMVPKSVRLTLTEVD